MAIRGAVLALVLAAAFAAPAKAETIQELAAKAKGQSLAINHQANDSFDLVLAEFANKFDIKVETTVSRPSSTLTRIRTEQKSGQYVWDLWWGGTSNMTQEAIPAGLLDKVEDYIVLPELKDPKTWRAPDWIYADAGHKVFAHIYQLQPAVLRNFSVEPGLKVETADDLLDPKLKGKIVMRDASVPNIGTFGLATVYQAKGPDFLKKLFAEQQPKVFENPQQLAQAITRGGAAISIGLENNIYQQCRTDGGCKDIEPLPHFMVASCLGFGVPNKPPHPDAVRLFINWFLSKEGQEAVVREFPKFNDTGSISLRKDVAPAPGQESSLPDFTHPEQYVFVSTDKSVTQIADTIRIFKEAHAR
jgi:iron(III) transport system substrate-binding protein